MKYFLSLIILSFSFSIQIMNLTGNINNFSQMNTGTHFSKNHRLSTNNIAGISFIQLPSSILFSEFFSQFSYKNLLITPRIGIVDYGTLSSISNNDFNPSESIVEVTLYKHTTNTRYGGSIAYVRSKIENYKSSLVLYNIGVAHAFFNNQFHINFSLENNIKIIKQYSNFMNEYHPYKRLNCNYSLQYLPLDVAIDFLHGGDFSSTSLAFKVDLHDNFNLYGAKKFYLSDIDYHIIDNISMGLAVITTKFQFNFGIQLLSASAISYGTSLIINIK